MLKHGYHRWSSRAGPVDVRAPWALIVDESVGVGAERLLAVLGVDLSKWAFDRPLCLGDVSVLHLEVRSQWKGEDVGAVLGQAGKGLRVAQVLSDCGSNLLKASELCGHVHVPDCSHALAAILERHLAPREDFRALVHLAGELRRHWTTSQYARWRPPKVRGKSRFMNVFPLVKWAEKMLEKEAGLPPKVLQDTGWLRQNRAFVEALGALRHTASGILSLLKTRGASARSLEEAEGALEEGQADILQAINADIRAYLKKLGAKLDGETRTFLCCSDIIETLFGKFKCRLSPHANSGITNLALIIPHFCGTTSRAQVKDALENVRNQQVQNWKKEQANSNHNDPQNGGKKYPHF